MNRAVQLEVNGYPIRIPNPDKLLWPEANITKLDYIHYLIEIEPYLLPYTQNRLLTTIRYPDGLDGKWFYQKNLPTFAPKWIPTYTYKNTKYVMLNNLPTLVWLGSHACLEFHVPFNLYDQAYPTVLAFDLDPYNVDYFDAVLEVALYLKEIFDSLQLVSYPKTSGASGLQIYLPIRPIYSYEQTNQFHQFIAKYLAEKYPHLVTIERLKKNRGTKIYVDYLQHGAGKTLPAAYSPRAQREATVSAPVTWEEVQQGISPYDFTMTNMKQRLEKNGDLFAAIQSPSAEQSIDDILRFLHK